MTQPTSCWACVIWELYGRCVGCIPHITRRNSTQRCKERREPQSEDADIASRCSLNARVSQVSTDAEMSQRPPWLAGVAKRVRSTIRKNAGTLFFGDERGVDSNPPSSFSASLCGPLHLCVKNTKGVTHANHQNAGNWGWPKMRGGLYSRPAANSWQANANCQPDQLRETVT